MDIPPDARFSGLLDAESRHRADPWSFSIPRSDVRASLLRGDRVKLLFGVGDGSAPSAERMWVEVVEVGPDGYVGRLENEPIAIADLRPGALVPFEARHVAATYREGPFVPAPADLAIVSDRIWIEGASPTLAVRMPEAGDGFSGWVLLAEEDPEPPPADLAGYRPVSHEALLSRYRTLDSIDDEAPGTRWRWDAELLEWVSSRG